MGAPNQTYQGTVSTLEAGTSNDLRFIGLTTPGITQDLIDYTVPASTTMAALQVIVSCNEQSKITITVDGTLIGSGRVGPGSPNFNFSWIPWKEVLTTEQFKVTFTQISSRPAVDVECYFQNRLLSV